VTLEIDITFNRVSDDEIQEKQTMTETEGEPSQKTLKEFADAVSTQAQVTNRIWLGLMTVALVALLPRESTTAGQVKLPFNLGQADAATFSVMIFLFLVVLTIAFSSAYAQQFRAQRLAQLFINAIPKKHTDHGGAHSREWFDMFRIPTFNRGAPLPQLARGHFQFYKNAKECPNWLRFLTTGYYLLLKLTAMAVYFALPGYALFGAYHKLDTVGWLRWAFFVAGILAFLTLVEVALADIISLWRVLPIIWWGEDRHSNTE
jgi:hypothetical protein